MNEQMAALLTELNKRSKELDEVFRNYSRRCGIPDMVFWILYSVWERRQACTQKELCEDWSWAKQTVNSALKNMEKQGLIRLSPVPDNRKNKLIVLMPAGKELIRRTVIPLMEAEQEAFAGLTPKEREELLRLMQKHTELLRVTTEKLENTGKPDGFLEN